LPHGDEPVSYGRGASHDFDVSRPHVARMYDWLLGGKDNLAVDREAGQRVVKAYPNARIAARANRAFLGHAVGWLAASRGVRQFLDIGTGIPTSPNVHQIAHQVNPDARVVYVDNDPYVLAHAGALLADERRTIAVRGDLRDPWRIVTDPDIRGHLDFSQPVALLLVAVLHFVEGHGAAYEAMRILRNRLAPGSYVVISHLLGESDRADVRAAREVYDGANVRAVSRTGEQIARLLEGTDPVPPGLVHISDWKIGGEDFQPAGNVASMYDRCTLADVPLMCGIGRKV
jgi:hypothetical protein